ncbi:Cdc3-like septin [Planoprotostelium fungivorum]|uniref:Cdc3-like septin n=1 Tax=Planoprotostelium fungivorum TaxID=1890364 RepID=A0A2P6NHG5_9EUKA|nr:Cdc3-like septin [Planoprotostelium fungivorum]
MHDLFTISERQCDSPKNDGDGADPAYEATVQTEHNDASTVTVELVEDLPSTQSIITITSPPSEASSTSSIDSGPASANIFTVDVPQSQTAFSFPSLPPTLPRAISASSIATMALESTQDANATPSRVNSSAANSLPPTTPMKNHNLTPITSPTRNPGPIRQKRLTLTGAGESGLGKTTFMGSLLVDGQGKTCPADGETKELKRRVFEAKMDPDCGAGTWTIETLDNRGYTGDVYQMSTVEYNIIEEYGNSSKGADLCFYFIAPQRIKEIDFYFIKRLSRLITVVVLVGKSDCMNQKERREFEQLVEQKLCDERIDVFTTEVDGGKMKSVFFAVGAETSDNGQPTGRKYDWGTAEPEEHSDVGILRTAILKDRYKWMKERKTNFRKKINSQFKLIRAAQQFHRKHHSVITKLSWFLLFLVVACIAAFTTHKWMVYAWESHKEALHMDEMQNIRIRSAVMQDDMRRRQAEMEREFDLKKQLLGEKACDSATVEITRLEGLLSQEKASRGQVMKDYVKSRDAHDALMRDYESMFVTNLVAIGIGLFAFVVWSLWKKRNNE